MNFEQSFPFLFGQIASSFRIALEKLMTEIGLHGGQVFVLIELWKDDGLSQIDLAQKLNVSPPTVNKMVKSLFEKGFVNCQKCGGDGRIMRVFLTNEGNLIRPRVEEQWKKIEEQLLLNLTETEKLVLQQLYLKLKENLLPLRF